MSTATGDALGMIVRSCSWFLYIFAILIVICRLTNYVELRQHFYINISGFVTNKHGFMVLRKIMYNQFCQQWEHLAAMAMGIILFAASFK